jgi:ribosome-binding factor A
MARERQESESRGGGAGYRHARLERVVHDELDEILRDEVEDPTLADVKITHVTLSIDYRAAKVYYTCTSRREVERALERASGFMRARLADAVELKRVPELRFVYDAFAPSGTDESKREGV